MAVSLSFIGGAGWQFFDDNGDPLSGGKIYTYDAGTTTPRTTYTSYSGLTPNTNPIILDSAGRTPAEIWATNGVSYKYVIKTSTDILIRTWDNIGVSNLADELSSTSDNTKGDALVGFRQSNAAGFLANATARTVNDKLQETVSVKDFGAVGDGVTDDYAAIQAAVAYINSQGGGTLVFPNGTYFVNHFIDTNPASPNGIQSFTFANCNGLVIDGQGSTVQMKGGWVMTNDYSIGPFSYSYKRSIGFYFSSCDNMEIRNFSVDGGAATITRGAGLNAENQSHGIGIEACYNVTCTGVSAKYCCTDGIYISSLSGAPGSKISKNVNFTRCQSTNNARQGMSIVQMRRGTFTECTFSNIGASHTGTFGGFSPSAGVDIEPNVNNLEDKTGDITFVNCSFANSDGYDFICSNATSTPYPINFFGCYFGTTDASAAPAIIPASKYVKFYACFFENESVYPNFSFSASTNDAHVELYGCLFRNNNPDYSVILYSPGVANPQTKLVVDNCSFYFDAPTPRTTYRIYVQDANGGANSFFTNNEIFISAAEHAGATFDVAFLIQNVLRSTGNTWKTDLTTAGKVFTVSYNSAVSINDYYANNTYISPTTGAWPSQIYSPTTQQFGVLQDASSQITQRYGSADPALGTGTWARGDIVYDTTPTSGSHIGWVCTVAGTPGTWRTFGLIS